MFGAKKPKARLEGCVLSVLRSVPHRRAVAVAGVLLQPPGPHVLGVLRLAGTEPVQYAMVDKVRRAEQK